MSRVWLGWGRSVWTRHMRMDETYVYGWGIRVWMGHTCMDGAYVYGWGMNPPPLGDTGSGSSFAKCTKVMKDIMGIDQVL